MVRICREPSDVLGLRRLVFTIVFVTVASDLSRHIKSSASTSARNNEVRASSWIGAVPTAAELYGDSSDTANAFEDDDDDDEGLDSAATNEYPDGE